MTDRTTRAKRALELAGMFLGEPGEIGEAAPVLEALAQDVIELEAECGRLREALVMRNDMVFRSEFDAERSWLESVIAAGREMYERACAERDECENRIGAVLAASTDLEAHYQAWLARVMGERAWYVAVTNAGREMWARACAERERWREHCKTAQSNEAAIRAEIERGADQAASFFRATVDALKAECEHLRKVATEARDHSTALSADNVRLADVCAEKDGELAALHAAYAKLTDECAAYSAILKTLWVLIGNHDARKASGDNTESSLVSLGAAVFMLRARVQRVLGKAT